MKEYSFRIDKFKHILGYDSFHTTLFVFPMLFPEKLSLICTSYFAPHYPSPVNPSLLAAFLIVAYDQ